MSCHVNHSIPSVCSGPCVSNDNTLVLEGIAFTRQDLQKSVSEAGDFNKKLPSITCDADSSLKCTVVPDWAPKLVRRAGPVQAVLDKIGATAFVKRRPEDVSGHRHYVERMFDAQKPLTFRIAVGPIKNMRCCGEAQYVDLAEYLGCVQLSRVMAAVSAVYPYGVRVEMVPDDLRAKTANRCPDHYVQRYISSLKALVENLGYSKWLTVTDGQAVLYEQYKTASFWDVAEEKIYQWKANEPEAFAARWAAACDNAEKNFNMALGCFSEQEVHEAAWRYLVAHQSEIMSGMWSTDDVFPLMYANHPNNYQLFTIAQKQTKLPWQISLPKSLLESVPEPLRF